MSQGLGLQAIAHDLGMDFSLRLKTDATAAMGMCRRLGVGKIRHLDAALLWVQEHVRSGKVELEKVPGQENCADLLTKHLSGPDIRAHLQRMGLHFETGRAESAPQLTSSLSSELVQTCEILRMQHRLEELRQEHLKSLLH